MGNWMSSFSDVRFSGETAPIVLARRPTEDEIREQHLGPDMLSRHRGVWCQESSDLAHPAPQQPVSDGFWLRFEFVSDSPPTGSREEMEKR